MARTKDSDEGHSKVARLAPASFRVALQAIPFGPVLAQLWSEWNCEKRFRRLEKITARILPIIDRNRWKIDQGAVNSDEFATFAIRVKEIAERDHREFKHNCLAWMLARAASEGFSDLPFTVHEHFLSVLDFIGPHHLEVLYRLLNKCDRTERPATILSMNWRELKDQMQTLPTPKEVFLVSATGYLLSAGLVHRKGGEGMTVGEEGNIRPEVSELGIAQRAKWRITPLGLRFIDYVGSEESAEQAIRDERCPGDE